MSLFLDWHQVDPSDRAWIKLSISFLKTVKPSLHDPQKNRFSVSVFQARMSEKKMVATASGGSPRPRTESMFEIWMGTDHTSGDESLVLFLDRTLKRDDPKDPNSKINRDFWCVTMGVLSNTPPFTAKYAYDEIKTFLKRQFQQKNRRLAVVWDSAINQLQAGNFGDAVFNELVIDINSNGSKAYDYQGALLDKDHFPGNVPEEVAYNHFAKGYAPPAKIKMARIEFN